MPTGTEGDYEVGYGKPPRGAGFKKGQSGDPRGRPPGAKNLTTLLNEPVTVTENGRRHKVTKREAVIEQLVNKSASVKARSLKILLDLMLNLEPRARSSAAPPAVGPADEEILAQLKARLEGAIQDQIASEKRCRSLTFTLKRLRHTFRLSSRGPSVCGPTTSPSPGYPPPGSSEGHLRRPVRQCARGYAERSESARLRAHSG